MGFNDSRPRRSLVVVSDRASVQIGYEKWLDRQASAPRPRSAYQRGRGHVRGGPWSERRPRRSARRSAWWARVNDGREASPPAGRQRPREYPELAAIDAAYRRVGIEPAVVEPAGTADARATGAGRRERTELALGGAPQIDA